MFTQLPPAFLTGAMPPARPIPFEQFRVAFLANYDPSQRAPATRRGMQDVLRALEKLGVESTDQLTVDLLNRYVASMSAGLSPNTLLGRLRYVQRICSIAFRSGYVAMNPFFIKPVREFARKVPSRKAKQWHSPADISKVLDMMEKHATERTGFAGWRARRTLAVGTTLAYTGARATEVYWLETTDVRPGTCPAGHSAEAGAPAQDRLKRALRFDAAEAGRCASGVDAAPPFPAARLRRGHDVRPGFSRRPTASAPGHREARGRNPATASRPSGLKPALRDSTR